MPNPDSCSIAIMAKAPLPGFCKTRLIPHLGAKGAARLQKALTLRTLRTALASNLGPVTLYCTPDCRHGNFSRLRAHHDVRLHRQSGTDLGQRMLQAIRRELNETSRVIILGTDCPALECDNLITAAQRLSDTDHVLQPAEDGGYVMLATRRYQPAIFRYMQWGGPQVMRQTRRRLASTGDSWVTLEKSWDVDDWRDYRRLQHTGLLADLL